MLSAIAIAKKRVDNLSSSSTIRLPRFVFRFNTAGNQIGRNVQ
ncbi:hypothetical protein FHW67_000763 [Herbaspirillum sp. Sphag1AN]|nr:hypothetical protein [Herbaspirillum sp. Sphag1AN]MBB3245219.1 hypothetical protein [Herbaspirillum sp. Sphag64]